MRTLSSIAQLQKLKLLTRVKAHKISQFNWAHGYIAACPVKIVFFLSVAHTSARTRITTHGVLVRNVVRDTISPPATPLREVIDREFDIPAPSRIAASISSAVASPRSNILTASTMYGISLPDPSLAHSRHPL